MLLNSLLPGGPFLLHAITDPLPDCSSHRSMRFPASDAPGCSLAPPMNVDTLLQSCNGLFETISFGLPFRKDGDYVHNPPFGFGGCHCR
jgi:hypothetical protein